MIYNKQLFISLLFLCFLQSIKAQNTYEYYLSLFDDDTIDIPEIQKVADSIINLYDNNDEQSEIIRIAHHFSIEHYKRKSYEEAITYAKKEIVIYEKLGIRDYKYAKALYNLALYYSRLDEYKDSFIHHKKVIELDEDEYSTAKSYCEIGKYYKEVGDFFKSKDYYSRGIYLLEKLDKKRLLIKKYIDFSQVLGRIDTENSLDKQLEILDKTNILFNNTPAYSLRDYYSMNNGYAHYYNSYARFNFSKSKKYYTKNLKEAIKNEDSTVVNISYTNLGNLYIDSKNEKQRDSALFFLKNSLRYATSKEEESYVYYNLSNYYIVKNQYHDALDNIQKVLMASVDLSDSVDDVPKLNSLINASNQDNVLGALIQKATILIKLYDRDQEVDHIKRALNNLLCADQLVDVLLDVSKEEGSRLHWRKEASEIYLKGIKVCKILDKKEKAFYFSEKKKALLLTEDILENTEKVQLPSDILEKENEFKKQILDLENRIANQKHQDSLKLLENKRFELKQQYQEQEDSLKVSFPAYYKDKETTRIIDLKSVQDALDNDSVIISYVSNKDEDDDSYSAVYATLISKTQSEIIKIGDLDKLEELVRAYRSQLSKPFETEQDRTAYVETASELYTLLIPKDKISMSLDQKHLIVIPDGTLQYIPFESLIVDEKTNRYLIEDNEVSYAYSMSFLQHNATVKRIPSQDLVSFAPVNFTHDGLEDINNSNDEIARITASVVGDRYNEKEASKNNFLSNTADYKIIHLATHANFSENLQVAFHDTNLDYHELYTSKNQAELIVLSACNTSLGEIAEGEGVMSLARGFFYAGANTVVSSLWNANDKSTARIMESFYSNLKEGQTKSKALHNAKINYLKSASLSDASPHYWATFVLIGDSETELFPSNTLLYGILLSLLFVLVISILIFFLKKS